MIKFIASDLDGTLLKKGGVLPKETFSLIEEMHERGILFAPASGRQYANLKELFAPVKDKVLFICENGALVKYRGETVHLHPVDDRCLRDALREIRALPHLYPMLCGTRSAYIEDSKEPFYTHAVESYTNCEKVKNLEEVIGREEICKIAVYDEIAAAENCIKVLPKRLPRLRTIISGYDWCDVSAPNASKGEAIQVVQRRFGFAKEECAAFGDHMNDYEMLTACGRPFVTENAYPPLKKLIGRTVPSNAEEGVIVKIKELLKEMEEEG